LREREVPGHGERRYCHHGANGNGQGTAKPLSSGHAGMARRHKRPSSARSANDFGRIVRWGVSAQGETGVGGACLLRTTSSAMTCGRSRAGFGSSPAAAWPSRITLVDHSGSLWSGPSAAMAVRGRGRGALAVAGASESSTACTAPGVAGFAMIWHTPRLAFQTRLGSCAKPGRCGLSSASAPTCLSP